MIEKKLTIDELISTIIKKALEMHLHAVPNDLEYDVNFSELGIDSQLAVEISVEISNMVGYNLPPTLLWDYPTVFKLIQGIKKSLQSGDTSHNKLNVSDSETITNIADDVDDVAVIGLGCRFPNAENIESYWQLLVNGENAISTTSYLRGNSQLNYPGGYIPDIDKFDNQFFNISVAEAIEMDPQQRLLLEVCIDALVDAGIPLLSLSESMTSVFIGISGNDYTTPLGATSNIFTVLGNTHSIAANRISYFLNLKGPSFSVDTACSSSLAAVHLACQSLKNQESALAICGGVNALLDEKLFEVLNTAGMLNPEGQCRTFDRDANGYVRGEGVGIAILKPLRSAMQDGNHIYAVIKGSAVNQDGATNGLTAPNVAAQVEVIERACRQAKVEPHHLQYIELHGTGTKLGDTMEAKAIGIALSKNRPKKSDPTLVGSVKSNIGHLEAAAGIASLIKVCLAIQHKIIPATLHVDNPNPYISFDACHIALSARPSSWPSSSSGVTLASVSSFGFGGTNVHVVLGSAPHQSNNQINYKVDKLENTVLTISTKTENGLKHHVQNHIKYINSYKDKLPFAKFIYNAVVRGSHHERRLAFIANDYDELLIILEKYLNDQMDHSIISAKLNNTKNKLAFVFSGQGEISFASARTLLRTETIFYETIERIDRIFSKHADWSIMSYLASTQIDDVEYKKTNIIQPLIFAIQIGLVELWKSMEIVPDAVVGHSIGEITAACVAGVLELEEAVYMVFNRAELLQRWENKGCMLLVKSPVAALYSIIDQFRGHAEISVFNSSEWHVVSILVDYQEKFITLLKAANLFYKVTLPHYPFHGPWLEQEAKLFTDTITSKFNTPLIPFYSTVTGKQIHAPVAASHWHDNIVKPVKFTHTIKDLLIDGYHAFLEIGAQSLLTSFIEEAARHHDNIPIIAIPTIQNNNTSVSQLLKSSVTLFVNNFPLSLSHFYKDQFESSINLPLYPWQRKFFWHSNSEGEDETQNLHTHNYDSNVKQKQGRLLYSNVEDNVYYLLSNLLDYTKFDRKTHFLEAGITSLIAIQLLAQINQIYDTDLTIAAMFTYPTILDLSNFVSMKIANRQLEESM